MIPPFNQLGVLPEGIHWSDVDELKRRFGINPHRLRLLSGFLRAVEIFRAAGCGGIYLDGSFVSAKEFPGDYDACWDVANVSVAALDPVLLDFRNFRAAQKAKFFGEFFPAHANTKGTSGFQAFLQFFQIEKTSGEKKGIVGINFKGHL